jgi:DNA ligase-1
MRQMHKETHLNAALHDQLICATFNSMEHVEELPTIYGVEKNGKTKVWTARIYRDVLNGFAMAEIEYGQLDGKKQTTSREYTEGKNLGKKNETTPLQQCLSETRRKWQDKMEKEGYSLVIPNSETQTTNANIVTNANKVFPMLAHTYEPPSSKNKKNGIVFPCYVQPKLDGLRCICYMVPNGSSNESKVVAQSRTGAYFETVEHICAELRPILLKNPGLILDGELYTPDMPFEELVGLIKRKKATTTNANANIHCIKYHIYDIVVDGVPYSERHDRIVQIADGPKCHLEVVHTQPIHDLNAFQQAFGEYVASGYEGIMLRNVAGPYRQNYRSHDLQKYKEFVEAEYPIVGFKEADGRDKGTVVWVCATAECRQFSVRPRGTQEQRRQWFQDGHKYQGKLLTVIYQELSELNVPRFPVGKAIRDGY